MAIGHILLILFLLYAFSEFGHAQGTATKIISGPTLPAVCTPGTQNLFMLTTAASADAPGLYECTGTNIWGQVNGGAYWGQAPVFNAADPLFLAADPCASILNVYSNALYLLAANAVVDATGFTGSQNCASNMLAITRPTWIKLGNVTLHVTVNQAAGFPTSSILAAPATPTTNTNTTTGGTLSNAVFVKVGYVTAWIPAQVNTLGPSAELVASMNAACSGTPTCTETVNSPAAVVGAYGYNVYESNTTGTEKLCNVAPIPIGVNYKITANCAGVAINTANLAFVDLSVLSGEGDSTKISLENAAASIDASGTWNWLFKDMSISSNLTTQSVNGMLQMGNLIQADNLSFSGGGNHIYITGFLDTVRRTRHFGFTQTTGPVSGIAGFNTKWLRIEDTLFSNFTFPVSPTTNYGISLNQCYMCTVDGERSENVDNSLAVNGGSMLVATGDNTVANASSHILFANFTCDVLINVNCADFTGMTHHAQMLNADCNGTNNVTGVGANILGADCYDIFMASNYTLTNLKGSNRGGPGGACCPTLEIYSSADGTVNGGEFSNDKSNEGVRIVGSPALSFNGVITSRNQNSGVVLADATTIVTCNGTTTVAWVSGQPFGPWQFNQQVGIGAGPTFFNLDHTVDSHTLVLTTTCGLGASQAFFVATADFTVNGGKADDNGQAGTGTGVRTGLAEGYYFSGHSIGILNGLTCNDNAPILANKHQQYCARAENNAIFTVNMVDGSGNGGGSNCLKVLKPMGSATEWFCDSPGNSGGFARDGTTNKVISLTPLVSNFGVFDQGQSATVADTGAINTTETIIAKSLALPANRLVAGTVIRIPFVGTNTSSVANTSTFTLRMGTAGTTADTAIFTAVMAVSATTGTGVPFEGEVICNVRTAGASGTGFCKVSLKNPNGTSVATPSTGISVIPLQLVLPAMSTFNTTTANQFISLTYKSAATTTTSIFKIGDILFSHL